MCSDDVRYRMYGYDNGDVMPVNYKFMKVGTKDIVPINTIDAMVCEMVGKKVDPDEFSIEFECLTMLGMSACWHGGPTNKELVEKEIASMKANNAREHNPPTWNDDCVIIKMYRRFLYEEYIFDAWR